MSVRKKSGKEAHDGNICAAIVDAVSTLWNRHAKEIHRIREDSEEKKISVSFASEIDCAESEPLITTRIRYTESFTDKITSRLDDPDQGTFETVIEESKKKKKEKETTAGQE